MNQTKFPSIANGQRLLEVRHFSPESSANFLEDSLFSSQDDLNPNFSEDSKEVFSSKQIRRFQKSAKRIFER